MCVTVNIVSCQVNVTASTVSCDMCDNQLCVTYVCDSQLSVMTCHVGVTAVDIA